MMTLGYGKLANATNTDLGASGKLLRLVVVGINTFNENQGGAYDGSGNGTASHLVFQFQNVPVKHRMSDTDDNTGGYAVSEMRKYLVPVGGVGGNFLAGLSAAGVPEAILWAPKRYSANKGKDATAAVLSEDKLWLPTEWEMFGRNLNSSLAYETASNQARFAYYADDASRVKKDLSANVTFYWLASPFSPNYTSSFAATSFSGVGSQGNGNVSPATSSTGVAPAFCVR
jgi:hypothetical protein